MLIRDQKKKKKIHLGNLYEDRNEKMQFYSGNARAGAGRHSVSEYDERDYWRCDVLIIL